MTVIFDLDYTLMDTAALKEAMRDAVVKFGPTAAQFDEAYAKTVARGKSYDYDPREHVRNMQQHFSSAAVMREAHDAVIETLKGCGRFLFPEAVPLLGVLHARGARLVLLTMGNESWQRAKIEFSGLEMLFDEVITTSRRKGVIVASFAGHHETIVVNDNGEEVKEMKAAAPGFSYILVKGPKPVPPHLNVPECANLHEVAEEIGRLTEYAIAADLDARMKNAGK